METKIRTKITVQTRIHAPLVKVWKCWISPEDIVKWNHASPDWHTTKAENDLSDGGKFSYRMEARDGSAGFDFWGIYDRVILNEQIRFTLGDGRKVEVRFIADGNETEVVETFEAEDVNSIELQRGGWQAILNNFKTYTETK